MPGVYMCDVIGDGTSTSNAFRPDLPAGTRFSCIMIDQVKSRALVLSTADTITHPGVTVVVAEATWPQLRSTATSSGPGAPKRNAVNTWLTNRGYETLPACATTWAEVIHFIARQVNALADLDKTTVA